MGNYYALYHKKESLDLKLKTMPFKGFRMGMESYVDGGTIVTFNRNYYVCGDRKKLKAFAVKMKEEWIKELKDNLIHLENLKI